MIILLVLLYRAYGE